MAKFSNSTPKRREPTSAIKTASEPTGKTFEGGAGYLRTPEGEAFLLAAGGFLGGEKTFYESGHERDERFRHLIRELSVANPDWVAAFLFWLRRDGNIRTAAIMGAAEYAWARRDEMGTGRTGIVHPKPSKTTRQVVASVLLRADEPQELIGYWMAHYGRSIPKPIKRGVSDAIDTLYNEYSVLKYDSDKRGLRMADVLSLVHPTAHNAKQSALFDYLMARRFGRVDRFDIKSLPVIASREDLMRLTTDQRRALLDDPEIAQILSGAGFTWESLAGWLQGPMDAQAWQSIIPTMGYMALLRNLRNFDQAGVSDGIAVKIANRISDPVEVTKSRQFPFRFLSAYQSVGSDRWSQALEVALNHSLHNVPALSGNTLILVDRSGSMYTRASERSELTRADQAAVFGTALALRAENANLVEFGTGSRVISFGRGDSVLRTIYKFTSLGGTDTADAVRRHFKSHDRLIIITDEQATGSTRWGWYGNPLETVPQSVPVYTWNLAGERYGHAPSGEANRHTFGGLTDSSFRMIPMIESGVDGVWPWENRG